MKICNYTEKGQLRFGNLNDQIWEDCSPVRAAVIQAQVHTNSILSLHSLIRK